VGGGGGGAQKVLVLISNTHKFVTIQQVFTELFYESTHDLHQRIFL